MTPQGCGARIPVALASLLAAAHFGCTSADPDGSGATAASSQTGASSSEAQGAGGGATTASGGGGAGTGASSSTGTGGDVVVPVPAGEWYEAPNSHMEDVAHSVDGPNMWDVSCVMSCWCGGAYDSKRDRLVVWGGGHGQYSGNELYAFSVGSQSWSRLDDPSNPPGEDVPYAPDGRPTSRHTYNYLQYVHAIDRFCTLGGAGFYPGGQTGTRNVDCYDFDTNSWETNVSVVPDGAAGYAFSAVDVSTGLVYQQGPFSGGKLARYQPTSATWTTLEGSDYIGSGHTTSAAFDPKRQKMVAIGDGLTVWDVDPVSNTVAISRPATTGDNALESAGPVGFDYDPVSETFIAWAGGQAIYLLDPDTLEWTKYAPSGAEPGPEEPNGTYGRFRYVPSANVFVVVSTSSTNVFMYRHTPDETAPQWYLDMIAQ